MQPLRDCVNNSLIHAEANNFNFQFISNLEHYNVDPSSITVSGISSGAAMATQFHFSHSNLIVGAGIVAGGFLHLYFDLCVNCDEILTVQCPTIAVSEVSRQLIFVCRIPVQLT